MTKIWKHFKTGWHVLEGMHTAIWILSVLGISFSSAAHIVQGLAEQKYLPFVVLLAQTVTWLLVTMLAVGYVGYRARTNRASTDRLATPIGIGGAGGGGTIIGNRGTVIGGPGGHGGVSGIGGHGGSGHVRGDDALIVGGGGGSAGTPDGRGGQGARSPIEQMGGPTDIWRFGRGGSGANHPEYNRRIEQLSRIRKEYMDYFPEEIPFIDAGVDVVPISWTNKRLEELGEAWRVSQGPGGYVLPPL